MRDCFLAAYDKFGKIDHARIISKGKVHVLLQAKRKKEGWVQGCATSWGPLLPVQKNYAVEILESAEVAGL